MPSEQPCKLYWSYFVHRGAVEVIPHGTLKEARKAYLTYQRSFADCGYSQQPREECEMLAFAMALGMEGVGA